MAAPQRKTPSHEVPRWLDSAREVYFVTVCCRERGAAQLTHPITAPALLETVAHRNAQGIWWAHLVLLMPDHVHALITFPDCGPTLPQVVSKWKEWTAKRHGVCWQRDFFEHRLRGEKEFDRKADYILQNPVRAGLVARAEDWPHVWEPNDPRGAWK